MTAPGPGPASPRVLVVGHYASERAGGAGSIPLRLLGRLRARGIEAWLLTHASCRDELRELLPPAEFERVFFAPSLPGFGAVFAAGRHLPPGLRTITWGITQLERQVAMLGVARRLVRDLAIDVVHQPISVSPVTPSPLRDLGAPVVMGPLNGGMELPPGLRGRDSVLYSLAKRGRPVAAAVLNALVRGRREAAVVLVANERTRALLPRPVRRRAAEISDIGVVLESWPEPAPPPGRDGPVRFLFIGRLVGWKAVDILLDAFAQVREKVDARLDVVGDGPERAALQDRAARAGAAAEVTFHGWLDRAGCAARLRDCDVFVSASLQESGGIAVLEAMACGRPVIASAWGGHLSTVDDQVGVLAAVSSRPDLVAGLAEAMIRLADDPELRARLGARGRVRVRERYDWDILLAQTLEIYRGLPAVPPARRVRPVRGKAAGREPQPRAGRPGAGSRPGPGARVSLAGLEFDRLTEAEVVDRVAAAAQQGHGGWVATPNVDICRVARADPALAALVTAAPVIVADGMPLIWAARLRGLDLPERVTGSSLIFSLSAAAAARGLSVYLLGGAPGVPAQAGLELQRRFPGLKVAGHDAPPVGFDAEPAAIDQVRRRLVTAAPDIVYVGLGFPKQERLIAALAPALPGAWFIGCGAAIPYAAGSLRRAPGWMQRAGLEWAFRLASEPRRLFSRYIVHDLPFTAALLVSAARGRPRGR